MATGADIMRRAGILLQDEGHVRWTAPELREWINDALRAIVLAKPSAKSASRVIALAEGTMQSLTDDAGAPTALALLGISRNIVSAGPPRVGGRAVSLTTKAQLDASDPWWSNPQRTRYQKEARQYAFDEENPLEFLVYPGNTGAGLVEALLSVVPAEITAGADVADATTYTDVIDLPEVYEPVIVDFVCYRCHSKDATASEPGMANDFYGKFSSALGVKLQVEAGTSPNARKGKS